MDEDQLTRALQRLHELTQQNAPESAGAAWLELLRQTAYASTGRLRPVEACDYIIEVVLRMQDLPIEELLS